MKMLTRQLQRIESDLLMTQQVQNPMERAVHGKAMAEQGLRQLVELARLYDVGDAGREIAVTANWYLWEMGEQWIDLGVDVYMDIFACDAWCERLDAFYNIAANSDEPLARELCGLIRPYMYDVGLRACPAT